MPIPEPLAAPHEIVPGVDSLMMATYGEWMSFEERYTGVLGASRISCGRAVAAICDRPEPGSDMPDSGVCCLHQVKAVQIHDLGPSFGKVLDELIATINRGIDLGDGS